MKIDLLFTKIDSMDINKLSKEEKEQLYAELSKERNKVQDEREAYKDLVDDTVASCCEKLRSLSATMIRVKQQVFEEFETVISMKNELFKVKGDRQSDTFTSRDGNISITLGNRVNEDWDDTAEAGIEKVKEYLSTLAKDDNSAALVNTVMRLLAKDASGTLKASKVIELEKMATETGNADFIDAINIIRRAYRPRPSCQFITLEVRDDETKSRVKVPLSLSSM